MKICTFVSLRLTLVSVIVLASSLFGFTPSAKGANIGFSTQFENIGGFGGEVSSVEFDNTSYVFFNIVSAVHHLNFALVRCWTDPSDTSEFYASLLIGGVKNMAPNTASYSNQLTFDTGDVRLVQKVGLNYWEHGPWVNYAMASFEITQVTLSHGTTDYSQFIYSNDSPYPGMTGFLWEVRVYGTFGPGEAGDALGLPFVQVPAPGAFGIAAIGGLVALRRRRAA